jgi:hypothetical protein
MHEEEDGNGVRRSRGTRSFKDIPKMYLPKKIEERIGGSTTRLLTWTDILFV